MKQRKSTKLQLPVVTWILINIRVPFSRNSKKSFTNLLYYIYLNFRIKILFQLILVTRLLFNSFFQLISRFTSVHNEMQQASKWKETITGYLPYPPFLLPSFPPSLPPSFPPSYTPSLVPFLHPSIPTTLTPSFPPSLPPSLLPSYISISLFTNRIFIAGVPYNISHIATMKSQLEIRYELWKYLEVTSLTIGEWKKLPFRKVVNIYC